MKKQTCILQDYFLHFEPIELLFLSNGLKNQYFTCNLFLQNFKTLTFLHDLAFHQIHPMNMHFHKMGHLFVVQKFRNQLQNFMHPFDSLKKLQFT
jgi:hypothetical protein